MLKVQTLPLILLSTLSYAGDMGAVSDEHKSSIFFGIGGGYNSIKLDQYLSPLDGTTNIYDGTTLVATGSANGPAVPFHDVKSTFSPEAQIGYLQHFINCDAFWGIKFAYKYLSVPFRDSDLVSPQFGNLTPVTDAGIGFTGRATIQAAQAQVNHELDLIPFIGHSFKKSQVYFGIGPSVFGTQTNIDDVVGYADVNSTHVNVSGAPTSFSSSSWMWGGVAQLGINYNLDQTWFVDMHYNYAISPHNSTNYFAPFSGTLENGYTKLGTLFGIATQYVAVQGFSITVNKLLEI